AMATNHERLRVLFARPELRRLLDRLQQWRESGRNLTGTLTLTTALAEERRAIDQLLRRPTSHGARLTIPLDALVEELKVAQLASSWAEVLEVVCGPPDPGRAAARAHALAWDELWRRAMNLDDKCSTIVPKWIEQLKREGVLKRLSGDRPHQAEIWIRQAVELFRQLPLENEPLAGVAARL